MIATLAATTLAASASDKDAKVPVAIAVADSAWSSTLFGTGIKTNDEYTDGNIFLTVPVWSTIGRDGTLGGSYLFVEPYTSVGGEGEVASSLGLSYRHLFSREPNSALKKTGRAALFEEGWFVGGSLFVDMLNTERDNRFWQLGVGAEIGSRYLELRGNYYIPLTDKKLAERNESTQTFSSSSTIYQQSGTGFGAPTAAGNQIVQDVNLTTSAITTTRTTTVKTVTEIFEEGMEGWDAEVSALLPWVDQWMDVRVIGGYFSFDNQPFGPQEFGTGNVHGWKLGAEVRPVPAVVLSAYWYEDKRFTGADWTVGLQLQVPLDRTWKDAFKMRRRHLIEHLAEPVHRQNDAIKVGNTKEQNSTSNTNVARVTRVVSQTQERLVLADDVIFVNNGGAVGNGIQAGDDPTGTGTAEKPKATIQAGADIAAVNNTTTGRVWNVYTQHNPVAPYTEEVAITQSTNFISSATPLVGKGGKSFGTGLMPVLEGSFATCGCSPLSFVGITGYEIKASSFAAIDMINVQNLKIASNKISNSLGMGIIVEMGFGNEGTAQITGNLITQTGLGMDGLSFFVYGTDSFLDAIVTGNTITGSGGSGVSFQVFDEALADLHMTGNNLIGNGSSGLSINLNFGDVIATLANNHFDANNTHGVHLFLADAASPDTESFLDFESVGDTFSSNVLNGLFIESYNGSDLFPGTVSFAHFENNGNRPLEVATDTSAFIDLTVENSVILSTNGLGVHGVVGEGAPGGIPNLSLFFFDSTIDVRGPGSAVGIQIEAPLTGVAALGVVGSDVMVNGLSPIGIQLLGTGVSCGCDPSIGALIFDSTITVWGITATGSGIGLDVAASASSGVALDIVNTTVFSGVTGVKVVAQDSAVVGLGIFDGSDIGAGTTVGVDVTARDSAVVDVDIFDSVVAGQRAISLDENPGAELNATVVGNLIYGGVANFSVVLFKKGTSTLADFTDNVITGGTYGITVNNFSSTNFTVNITNNTTDAYNTGIRVLGQGGDFDANINANTITGDGSAGIQLDGRSGTIHVNPDPTILNSNTIEMNRTFDLHVLSFGGVVDGSIIINGTTLTPPVTFP